VGACYFSRIKIGVLPDRRPEDMVPRIWPDLGSAQPDEQQEQQHGKQV